MTTQSTPRPTPTQPEPWLRGTYTDLPAALRAIVHTFEIAREDADLWCADLTDAELNARPFGLTPIAFHLRHIPRSLDRLLTYAEGNALNSEQIATMKAELAPNAAREALFTEFHQGFATATQRVRAFASADLEQSRGVGRVQLPTSVGGLLIHLADHTHRHVGQIVTTAKVILATR